jgi:hypothetical protein
VPIFIDRGAPLWNTLSPPKPAVFAAEIAVRARFV